jgi:hypothetical protein
MKVIIAGSRDIEKLDDIYAAMDNVVWDIEEVTPMHCTEGVAYAAGTVLNFHLAITVYGSKMITRNSIERQILDILQPQDLSGRRVPLQQEQKMNAFIRYMIWSSITEFPIPKTAQSNAEMSASVLMFNSSISVSE